MVVGAPQSFQFFRQNTWFLENNGALSKFSYDIFLYLISINKLLKKSVLKIQFYINHASNLKVIVRLITFCKYKMILTDEKATVTYNLVRVYNINLVRRNVFKIN